MTGIIAAMRMRLALLLLVCLTAFVPARADDCVPAVEQGWVRLPPAQMPMTAAFGRIRNDCAAPTTVVAASSPAFASVELHETRVVDGVNRMRHVPELRIAPGEAAELKPGGLHLMLMRPRAPLAEGGEVVVELELADGRRVRAAFEVRSAAGR